MSISGRDVRDVFGQSLEPGDDVMIHAALGALGHFDDGIEDVIDALLEAVAPGGTVIVMTDTRSFTKSAQFSRDQPSETGKITELFRQRPEAMRSRVPMVSFAAIGPRAEYYTREYNSHLDETAPITRLLEQDGKIMLMGVGYIKCTLYHLAEERHESPYNFYKTFEGVEVDETGRELGPISQRYFVRKDMGVKKDPAIAGSMLEERGESTVLTLGKGEVRTFKARDFDRCCMDALDKDPDAFLVHDLAATS